MEDTSKYLIHAAITAEGIVERSDVVGAIFGQTEGLLGDELDLRSLQQASKVGRIDVEIESEGGQSFGHVTIATSLDRVETSILAASLETITRVGPCRAQMQVTDIEDVREAKRREVVERAKELLAESFNESILTSEEILDEVRESVRVEDITEFAGLPAGPHVADSDAVVVVEGRADVLTLLKYGIKNAVAVEGTNVPDAISELTQERTVTAFLDGDRGGELILRELAQVGDVDYVAFAPDGESVEDLARPAVLSALRNKVPFETFEFDGDATATGQSEAEEDEADDAGTQTEQSAAVAETDGAGSAVGEGVSDALGVSPKPSPATPQTSQETASAASRDERTDRPSPDESNDADGDEETTASETREIDEAGGTDETGETDETDAASTARDDSADDEDAGEPVGTLRGIAREVIAEESGTACVTDDGFRRIGDADAADAFDLLKEAEKPPYALFLDGEITQRLLDVAAQRGTEHVIGRSVGDFVKRPVSVRIRTVEQLLGPQPMNE